MKYKVLPRKLQTQTNNILNKNERMATNIVDATPSSKFDKSHRHLTTFNSGYLVPIYVDECYPGDIHDIDVSTLIRLSTPNAATMENPIYDIHFYFVPWRIVWENFKYFMGENKTAGYQQQFQSLPLINYNVEHSYTEGDLASYLGFPLKKNLKNLFLPISALWFKAYGKIWNDYYRDQNLQSEIDISNNNSNDSNVNFQSYYNQSWNVSIQVGKNLAPVSRLADYFSTCLPYPQKGDSVSIDTLPLNSLRINLKDLSLIKRPTFYPNGNNTNNSTSDIIFRSGNNTPYYMYGDTSSTYNVSLKNSSSASTTQNWDFTKFAIGNNNFSWNSEGNVNYLSNAIEQDPNNPFFYNVNDLRLALAIQHMRELDSRGGTRYVEYLLNHFGVQASDTRLDRAEFIGGWRDNISINNIVQSSNGPTSSPLGVLGGVSVSSGHNPKKISYAVKEHGCIMGFVIVRPQMNYSQGLNKMFTRTQKLDFYDPLLANIGEQPVYKYEIYLDDLAESTNKNNEIFGYNEAWADLRYKHNIMSGYMSVNSSTTLASLYSYTEKYTAAPTLSNAWMTCKPQWIGSTLLLNNNQHEYIHQFLGDFYFNVQNTRKMPVFSIPGLRKV